MTKNQNIENKGGDKMLNKRSRFAVLKTVAIIPVTVMLAYGPASAAEAPKNLKELIAAAKKETTLRAMWSASSLNGGKGFRHIVAAMNKKYGTNIKPIFTPGPV